MKLRYILLLDTLLLLIVSLLIGIPQDAYSAFKNSSSSAEFTRLYNYHQTARIEGVPAALEKYGVQPQNSYSKTSN